MTQLHLALAAGLCLVGAPVLAQDTLLSPVTVQASTVPSVKNDTALSSKFTAPLLDVPMTVNVINDTVLEQTGATSLQEALQTVPGITFGNGEGGTPIGDLPYIRGLDATSSTFVDGMRDIAAGSREVFNLEAIEVIKGADSTFAGRGGAGGSINMSTKKAQDSDFLNADLGLGSDRYKRSTLDINRKLDDTTAVRLNAMAHDAHVPGRDGPKNKRWGIAPTVTFGMGTPTQATLSWQHLQSNDTPDGGLPYLYSNAQAEALPGGSVVRPTYGDSRKNWYGLGARDGRKERSDMFLASVQHQLTDRHSLRNSLRYTRSQQDYVWTLPDSGKGNVTQGYVWRRGNYRDANVRTLQNVTEFTGQDRTGAVDHRYVLGLELAHEKSVASFGAIQDKNTSTCTAASAWCASLNQPDSSAPYSYPHTPVEPDRDRINTIALYGFDTLKLNEQWLLNGGLRLDHYRLNTAGPAWRDNPAYRLQRTDTLLNYQVGVVYKPADNGSVYINFGTASRPGGGSLANANEDLSASTEALSRLEPEKTRAIELGTKWDVLDRKLGLTAAIFRNQVRNVRITENGMTYMGGNKVVNGLELGISGHITRAWSVYGGYTYMDSQQKNLGKDHIANGRPFFNTPKHSMSLWSTYQANAQLQLGLGIQAQSRVTQGYLRSSVDHGIVTKGVAGYSRYDAMASYQFNPNLALQLNVYNLTNKLYYQGVRSKNFANVAAGRSAVATLKFTY